MNALRIGSLAVVLLVCSSPCRLTAALAPDLPGQAVEELGDPSYTVRAEAEQRLRRLGRAAVAALEKGLKHADPEVRDRCALLLPLVRRSDLDIELDAFIQNQRDAKLPALPGWTRLKSYVSADLSARLLYAEFYRQDKALLELLEKDPAKVAAQFAGRLQKFQQKANQQLANKDLDAAVLEFQGLILAALCSTVDANQFNQMTNLFYSNVARAATVDHPGCRRLLGKLFAERMKDINQAQQYYYLANYLQLTELIESQIRPILEKQIDEAIKSKDFNRIVQVAYMVSNMQSFELAESKLRPAIQRVVDDAVKTDDYNQLQQAVQVCQVLQMQDLLQDRLKPAVARYILKSADHLKDMSRIWQSRYLAQTVGLTEMLDTALRPAVIKLAAEAVENAKDISSVHNAFFMANQLNMPEVVEGLLRPAARRAILTSLEQPGNWSQLNQAVNICQQLNLQDVLEESVKPVFLRTAPALVADAAKDPNQLQQLYYLATNLQANKVIEDQIKPALRKYFQTATIDKTNVNNTYQMMYLAKNLQIKEAVPFALKTAMAKDAGGYVRGLAVQFIGEFGTKEQVNQLEPLLKDTVEVGQAGINFTTVKAEVRDVALAVILLHKGENLANYGYPYFQMIQGITLYQTSAACAGFGDAAGRDGAFKKYNELLAKQKK